ncbi:MAG: hypothetical protein C4550_02105 [Nitrospiraceae bacterium]|nr:MAG: hypothetical protein C4550_02105 [Nitrospiraceae bacterium]
MSKIQDSGFRIQDKRHPASCIMHHDKSGFSLIEIIMIILIVSIAIPGLLLMLGGEAGRGVEPELRITATNIAQQLLDQIVTKCWDETAVLGGACTGSLIAYTALEIDGAPEVAMSLTTYDDVDDYTAGVPAVTVNGISYSRSVQACYVPFDNLTTATCNTTSATGTDYKRIAVTVARDNTSVTLTTVVTNY